MANSAAVGRRDWAGEGPHRVVAINAIPMKYQQIQGYSLDPVMAFVSRRHHVGLAPRSPNPIPGFRELSCAKTYFDIKVGASASPADQPSGL